MSIVSIDDLQKQESSKIISIDDLEKQVKANKPVGGVEDFLGQATKGFADTMHQIPGIRQFMDLNPELADMSKEIGSPKGAAGEVGKVVGQAAGLAPAFMGGEAAMAGGAAKELVGVATKKSMQKLATKKLIGGSAGIGLQEGVSDLEEGKSPKEAAKTAALATGTTLVAGKVLEGAGKAVMGIPKLFRDTSSRIHDYIVKLPKQAFSYSKDPLAVFNKENIVAPNITEYASKAQERLDLRFDELNKAVAENPARVDLKNVVDESVDSALNEAKSSLQDRTELAGKLEDMRVRIRQKYGNIDDMSLTDAVKLKRQLADEFPFSPMETKSSTNNLLSRVGHKIYGGINEAIDKVAPEVTELNQRTSGLIDISKAAQNRVIVESRSHPFGLIGSIAGATGGLAAGEISGQGHAKSVMMALGIPLAMKGITSPFVMTRVAWTLSHLADVDKVQLYKAYPWLLDVVHKAHEFVGSKKGGEASLPAAAAITAVSKPKKEVKISDEDKLLSILGEAEGEGLDGMRKLSSAINNRGTLDGVYGKDSIIKKEDGYYRKTSKGERRIPDYAVKNAKQAIEDTRDKDYANQADHWQSEADLKKNPKFAEKFKLQQTEKYKGHTYFKKKGKK